MQYMKSHQEYGYLSYYHKEAVADRTTDALLIPNTGREVSVSVTPGVVAGNDVTLEFTASHPEAIKAGTAVWHAWDGGPITTPMLVTLNRHLSAVRMISGGSATVEVFT